MDALVQSLVRAAAAEFTTFYEEVEHESWFSEFLGEGPSGHFRRAYPGESPYVSKFLVVPGANRRS